MKKSDNNRDERNPDEGNENPITDIKAEGEEKSDEKTGERTDPADAAAVAEAKFNEINDKYLRLYSEYDNYRKRTMRERAELIRTAGEDTLKAILPVVDDFERAMKASGKAEDVTSVKEGMQLIYNKLRKVIEQKGLTAFDSVGQPFDPDTMEAVTHIDARNEAEKGKVIDEIEKGYRLGDKVIRFAKVVVAR